MKEIKLTQGKVAIIDDEDFERLNQFKWCVKFDWRNWYARRMIRVNGKQTTLYMHRAIVNAPKCVQVDHRNGNGLDNCKENLRLCTHQQNQSNQRNAHKDNKFGIKGVNCHKKNKKFLPNLN